MSTATNFSRNGITDWLVQRVSAVILALYVLTLTFWFAFCPGGYESWYGFMMSLPMKVFSILACLSLMGHAWVGVWTIGTDYIKCACVRIAFQIAVAVALVVYFIWALTIFWG